MFYWPDGVIGDAISEMVKAEERAVGEKSRVRLKLGFSN